MAGMDEMNDDDAPRLEDMPHIDDPEVLMFEGMPVIGHGFKITGVTGGFDPRQQFNLAGLPSGTKVSGTWEGTVHDILHKKTKGKDEMTRIHCIKVGENDVIALTYAESDLDAE